MTTGSALATPRAVSAFLALTTRTRIGPPLVARGAVEAPMEQLGVYITDDDTVAAWLNQGIGWVPFQSAATNNDALHAFTFGFGLAFTQDATRVESPAGTRLV